MPTHALAVDPALHAHEAEPDAASSPAERLRSATVAAGTAAVRRLLVATKSTSLRLRSVPSLGPNVIGELPRHATVEAIGAEVNGFAEVRSSDGRAGWASAAFLRPGIEAAPEPSDATHLARIEGDAFVRGPGDRDEIDPYDVVQGKVGDCYYLSAMAAVARANPELIHKLIRKLDEHFYEVTLYQPDRTTGASGPIKIIINDDFSVESNGLPTNARPANFGKHGPELWVMLLEKAYASAAGSFKAIDGGSDETGLNLLLPGGANYFKTDAFKADELGALFDKSLRAHQPVVCGTCPDPDRLHELRTQFRWLPDWFLDPHAKRADEVGAVHGHEYALAGVDLKARRMSIQNPWHTDDLDLCFDDFKLVFESFAIGKK